MSDKLIKEVITTTTERFNDNGSIREKITESREKVYATEEKVVVANTTKEIKQEIPASELVKQETPSDDLIKDVAKSLDSKYQKKELATVDTNTTPNLNPTEINPWVPPVVNPPQYNVTNRNTNMPVVAKLPWEN